MHRATAGTPGGGRGPEPAGERPEDRVGERTAPPMTPSSGQDHSEPDAAWASTLARAGSARAEANQAAVPASPSANEIAARYPSTDAALSTRATFRWMSPALAGP